MGLPAQARRTAAALAVAAAALFAGCGGDEERPLPDGPNVVVITTDDQSMHSFSREIMPRTFELVVDEGTDFTDAIAAPPLCCPSRAGFLTGQYPHNNGVFSNDPGYGELRDPGDVLPVWMQDAGYTTGMVGKYLNGTVDVLRGEPAPGWDRWWEVKDLSYRGATVFDEGEEQQLGDDVYTPAAINDQAVDFIDSESGERPFFLWVATTAPHFRNDKGKSTCEGKAPQPLPEDLAAMRDLELPPSRAFDEVDVSDKPAEIAAERPLSARERQDATTFLRCTAGTLREVDRGVERIWESLKQAGEADDTVLLFHSDNGLFFGEHRIRSQKGQVYEPALKVPMAIRIPKAVLGGRQARAVDELVTNQDIAPTILELAGAEPCSGDGCREPDGRSLAGLIGGGRKPWAQDRGVLVEQGTCKYRAIRTSRWVFNLNLERAPGGDGCVDGERELYDLRRDPEQLENVAGTDRAIEAALADRLAALRECAGTSGPNACE